MTNRLKLAADIDRYFTSSNGVDVPARVSVPRDEWRQLHAALQAEQPDSPWTENVAVKLEPSRTGRVYIAGPMTGIDEFNFPSFNKEAVRLRAEGLTVLNPADHGIVEGAEWADYLRHDIAGLATCQRIHLLQGWEKSKGARLEVTIAQALGMAITLSDGAASPAAQATQAEAKTDEPVAWVRYRSDGGIDGPILNSDRRMDEVRRTFWTPLFTHPAPGVPDFSRIAKRKLTELQEQGFAITGYAIQCDTVRGFIDVGGFVGWWQGEPAPGVPDAVVRDAERWRYAIADGGNQSMNFIDIFDDWDGDGDFVEVFDAARIADKKGGAR